MQRPDIGRHHHAGTAGWQPALLAVLTLAFALRVAAQALQYWSPLAALPPFADFQGSNLPYSVLLASQLLILALMAATCVRVHRQTLVVHRRTGTLLLWLGGLYMAGSVARILIGMSVADAPAWFRAWISGVFHLVLAGFVLTLGLVHHRSGRR